MCKIDLIGKRFGRLTVLEEVERKVYLNGRKTRQWYCLCDCGGSKVVNQANPRSGGTKSCGCFKIDRSIEVNTVHGMHDTRQYRIWSGMKSRCDNPNETGYSYYGGSGITYDPNWASFENFRTDMGESYSDDLTLDWFNPHGDHSKENCRWIPFEKQSKNRRMGMDNNTGITGVNFRKTTHGGKWIAFWDKGGKQRSKSFSVDKYGFDEAFQLAREHRHKMIKKLNKQGDGYTIYHGL